MSKTMWGGFFGENTPMAKIAEELDKQDQKSKPEPVLDPKKLEALPYFPFKGKTWSCPPKMDYYLLTTEDVLRNNCSLYGDYRVASIRVINDLLIRGWIPPKDVVSAETLKKYLDEQNPKKEETPKSEEKKDAGLTPDPK